MKKTIGIIGSAGATRFTQAEICKAFGVPAHLVSEPATQQAQSVTGHGRERWMGVDLGAPGSDRTVATQFLLHQSIRIDLPPLDPERFTAAPLFGRILRPALPSLIDPRFADSGENSNRRAVDAVERCMKEMLDAARAQPRHMGKSFVRRFETKYGELLARNVYRGELIDERRELERKWQAEGSGKVRPARIRHLHKLRRYYRRVALWGVV